jgi:hypothetical protein
MVERGEHVEGLTRMRKALADWTESSSIEDRLWAQGIYAEALGGVGNFEEAFTEIDKAKDRRLIQKYL